jgi:hypothetical protein
MPNAKQKQPSNWLTVVLTIILWTLIVGLTALAIYEIYTDIFH